MNPEDCKTCRNKYCYCYPNACLGYEVDDETVKARVLDQAVERMIDACLHPKEKENVNRSQ